MSATTIDSVFATLAAGRFHVGGLLSIRVFDRLHGSVVTSATLTALSRFDRLGSALGLTGRDAAHFEALPSPFDLARQAKLIVRADAPDPKGPRHASFVASVVLEQAVAGRGYWCSSPRGRSCALSATCCRRRAATACSARALSA